MKKSSQVDDGCVLYLSNRKKSSTVWTDFSNGGNNGTVNGATLARNGYSFDGISNYIDCGNNSSLNITNAVTIIAWVNFTPNGTVFLRILSKNVDVNHRSYDLSINSSNNTIAFSVDAAASSGITSIGSIASNKWQLVAVSYSNPNATVFINGIFDSIANVGVLVSQATAKVIVGNFNTISRYWQNAIGEVRIYNRALSANEILNHYGKTRKFYGV